VPQLGNRGFRIHDSIEYRAESPDEAALAAGAAQLDVVFLGRKQNRVMVKEFGLDRIYTLEVTVPFDSDRKRMTVVVRADDGSYLVHVRPERAVSRDVICSGAKCTKKLERVVRSRTHATHARCVASFDVGDGGPVLAN
jgi:magnesium-transporting ATPase (P-type)